MSKESLKTQLGLADELEVAELLRMTPPSLRNQRARGQGPPFQRIGKRVFYPINELKKYLEASTVTPRRSKSLIDGKRK